MCIRDRSYAANTPSVDQAIKALGIEKSTPDFTYATKTIKDGVAIFEKVKMGSDSSADKIILSISPIDQNFDFQIFGASPVSYTHLDVYKRQVQLLFLMLWKMKA